MKRKLVLLGSLLALVALAVFACGLFDEELSDERRWTGLALIVVSFAVAVPAALRLAEDWPRLKPVHNVDVAFVQIGFGVFALTAAFWLGGRPWALLAPLAKPTPQVQQVPDQPATAASVAEQGGGRPAAPSRR